MTRQEEITGKFTDLSRETVANAQALLGAIEREIMDTDITKVDYGHIGSMARISSELVELLNIVEGNEE
jgi:hypothetical protein